MNAFYLFRPRNKSALYSTKKFIALKKPKNKTLIEKQKDINNDNSLVTNHSPTLITVLKRSRSFDDLKMLKLKVRKAAE